MGLLSREERRPSRSRGPHRAASPGRRGARPCRPMRRVAEQRQGQHRLDDEAGRGAQRRPPASPATQVEPEQGGQLDVAHAEAGRRDQGEHEEDGEQHRPRATRAGAQVAAGRRPERSGETASRTAPAPIAGSTTRSGSRWCAGRSRRAARRPRRAAGTPAAPREPEPEHGERPEHRRRELGDRPPDAQHDRPGARRPDPGPARPPTGTGRGAVQRFPARVSSAPATTPSSPASTVSPVMPHTLAHRARVAGEPEPVCGQPRRVPARRERVGRDRN